jgi:hypothetical protein
MIQQNEDTLEYQNLLPKLQIADSALPVHHMFTTTPSRVEIKPDSINVDCRFFVLKLIVV